MPGDRAVLMTHSISELEYVPIYPLNVLWEL